MTGSGEGKSDIGQDPDFSRIEELIKGNAFSREEITRLLEILNSRVDNELEKQNSSRNAGGDTQQVPQADDIHDTPFGENQQAIHGALTHENDDVPIEVGASPVDVARAYMASISESSHDKYNFMSKSEQVGYDSARKSFLRSNSPKPSIHWPGAILNDRHGYTTPENQRWRQRINDFPRTPYSRSILSKSSAKLPVDSGYENSTTFRQSQKSILGKVNSRGKTADGYGSVGPIRRIGNRISSEVRPGLSIFQNSPKKIPSKIIKPSMFEVPSTRDNLEPNDNGGDSKYSSGRNASCSSDVDVGEPNLYSSLAVRKILERLNKPTPKEKEAELQLATAWRRSSPLGATSTISGENASSVRVGELSSHTDTGIAAGRAVGDFSKMGKDMVFSEAKDVDTGNAVSSVPVFTGSRIVHGANFVPSRTRASDSVDKSSFENVFSKTNPEQIKTSSLFSFPQLTNGPVMKMTPDSEVSKNHGTKPSLPSLSISKPGFSAASSGNGPVFTFPVSASSGLLSELPTPTVMPSSSATSIPSPPTVPSYTFGGTNNANPRLVFSFPSTSSASETEDDSGLKFGFGSDNKDRLSFSFFEKEDAVCY